MNEIFENKHKVKHIWEDNNLTMNEKYVAVYLVLRGNGLPLFQQAFELGITENELSLHLDSLYQKKVNLDV